MYAYVCEYKFCIGIAANGWHDARGKAMGVHLYVVQGEYNHQLKWPALININLELIHQHNRHSN